MDKKKEKTFYNYLIVILSIIFLVYVVYYFTWSYFYEKPYVVYEEKWHLISTYTPDTTIHSIGTTTAVTYSGKVGGYKGPIEKIVNNTVNDYLEYKFDDIYRDSIPYEELNIYTKDKYEIQKIVSTSIIGNEYEAYIKKGVAPKIKLEYIYKDDATIKYYEYINDEYVLVDDE